MENIKIGESYTNYYEKQIVLERLKIGTVVQITTGEKFEFHQLKRKNFSGKSLGDGKNYNIPIAMFEKIISFPAARNIEAEISELKDGDYFIINHKNNPLVFIYRGKTAAKIKGEDPITSVMNTIDKSLFFKKI